MTILYSHRIHSLLDQVWPFKMIQIFVILIGSTVENHLTIVRSVCVFSDSFIFDWKEDATRYCMHLSWFDHTHKKHIPFFHFKVLFNCFYVQNSNGQVFHLFIKNTSEHWNVHIILFLKKNTSFEMTSYWCACIIF